MSKSRMYPTPEIISEQGGTITVRGGRLSIRELQAALVACPDPDAFVTIRNTPEANLHCDIRTVDSVSIRSGAVVLNLNKDKGWF